MKRFSRLDKAIFRKKTDAELKSKARFNWILGSVVTIEAIIFFGVYLYLVVEKLIDVNFLAVTAIVLFIMGYDCYATYERHILQLEIRSSSKKKK